MSILHGNHTRARKRSTCMGYMLSKAVVEALERRVLLSYVVTSLADDGANGTLRYEIQQADSAGGNQTITFASSLTSGGAATINLNGTGLELDNPLGTLAINGPGAGLLSVNAGGESSVFTVGSGYTAAISGLTITGGNASGGAGIYNNGTLTVTDCTLSGNTATDNFGGGIYSYNGTLTVNGCIVSGNAGGNCGGGIAVNGGTATVENSTLQNNTAVGAGGLYDGGTVTVTNCTITGNSSDNGGGIGTNNSANLTVTDSTLSGNTASSFGGGINDYNTNHFTLTDSTLYGNAATDHGGGLYTSNDNSTIVTDCTITGNSAASGEGGGICNNSGLTSLYGTIVGGNTNGDCGGYNTLTGTYNLIGTGGSDGLVNGTDHNIVGVSTPDMGLASLGNYGGPTETMALLPGSPAIGRGALFDGIDTDQRGESRTPMTPDIGAVQGIFLLVNTTSDPGSSGQVSLRSAISSARSFFCFL
jgi:parallel beta-helix repeat protein